MQRRPPAATSVGWVDEIGTKYGAVAVDPPGGGGNPDHQFLIFRLAAELIPEPQ